MGHLVLVLFSLLQKRYDVFLEPRLSFFFCFWLVTHFAFLKLKLDWAAEIQSMVGYILYAADIAILMHRDGSNVKIWLISLKNLWRMFNFWLEIAFFLVRFFRFILFYDNGSLFICFLRFLLFKAKLLPWRISSFFFYGCGRMVGLPGLFVNGTWLQLKSESLGILIFLLNTKVSSVEFSLPPWSFWWIFAVPLSSPLWTRLWLPIPMLFCVLSYSEDLIIGFFDDLFLLNCFF